MWSTSTKGISIEKSIETREKTTTTTTTKTQEIRNQTGLLKNTWLEKAVTTYIVNKSSTKKGRLYNRERTVPSARGIIKAGQPHINQWS